MEQNNEERNSGKETDDDDDDNEEEFLPGFTSFQDYSKVWHVMKPLYYYMMQAFKSLFEKLSYIF